jgi:hypothetical protein
MLAAKVTELWNRIKNLYRRHFHKFDDFRNSSLLTLVAYYNAIY